MRIAVVGTGYVGLVTGTCFAEYGVDVTCVDVDSDKIRSLQAGRVPFFEPGLQEILEKNARDGRLRFTTDLSEGLRHALAVFIAVGTPPRPDGSADLSYVEEVSRQIGRGLDGYKLVVTKSTVPAGTGAHIRRIIEQARPKPVRFSVASNPEFLREGSAVEDFMRPDRVVIGAEDDEAIAILKDLYSPLYLIEVPFVITDVVTSELIKYASNAFLATKISFINEIALLAERLGADVHLVAKGMGLDRRIGPKFLHPGPGFGGSCFPKDTRAVAAIAREKGMRLRVIEAVIEANEAQTEAAIAKVRRLAGPELRGKTVALLGLAFKPNTSDIRESPAMKILKALLADGAKVRAYDPAAMEEAAREVPGATYCSDPYEAAEGAEALVLATEWNPFRKLDLERLKSLLGRAVLVDLRNVYDPREVREMGFVWEGVGRGFPPGEPAR